LIFWTLDSADLVEVSIAAVLYICSGSVKLRSFMQTYRGRSRITKQSGKAVTVSYYENLQTSLQCYPVHTLGVDTTHLVVQAHNIHVESQSLYHFRFFLGGGGGGGSCGGGNSSTSTGYSLRKEAIACVSWA